MENIESVFSAETLAGLFPPEITDAFFEALLGDAEEGAYDIRLAFKGHQGPGSLAFVLELHERPGKCLACNLTYGLPEVLSRHPLINLNGLAVKIAALMGREASKAQWRLGATQSAGRSLHLIPLMITLA